jgi:hypothetical protein
VDATTSVSRMYITGINVKHHNRMELNCCENLKLLFLLINSVEVVEKPFFYLYSSLWREVFSLRYDELSVRSQRYEIRSCKSRCEIYVRPLCTVYVVRVHFSRSKMDLSVTDSDSDSDSERERERATTTSPTIAVSMTTTSEPVHIHDSDSGAGSNNASNRGSGSGSSSEAPAVNTSADDTTAPTDELAGQQSVDSQAERGNRTHTKSEESIGSNAYSNGNSGSDGRSDVNSSQEEVDRSTFISTHTDTPVRNRFASTDSVISSSTNMGNTSVYVSNKEQLKPGWEKNVRKHVFVLSSSGSLNSFLIKHYASV